MHWKNIVAQLACHLLVQQVAAGGIGGPGCDHGIERGTACERDGTLGRKLYNVVGIIVVKIDQVDIGLVRRPRELWQERRDGGASAGIVFKHQTDINAIR